ncbi:MAG: BON domain-containing protein [Chloroflexota bacterium]|nr:BON domain-containing protein [Chloroflexota bacterium]
MAEQVETFIRSDSRLSDEDADLVGRVRKALWEYEPLRASRPRLDVRVDGGRVILAGRMRTLAMKEIAEYLLRRLDGVNAVRNDIVADPEVIQAVADALAADPEFGPLCIRVDARDGDVVLAGDVPSEAIADRALDVASRVPIAERVGSRLIVRAEAANGSIGAPASPGRASELEPEIGAHVEP